MLTHGDFHVWNDDGGRPAKPPSGTTPKLSGIDATMRTMECLTLKLGGVNGAGTLWALLTYSANERC
jgi:hypothetical protein